MIEEEEDVTFSPEAAEIRPDEKECVTCHYLHFHKIECPNCNPLTKTQYERLSGVDSS